MAAGEHAGGTPRAQAEPRGGPEVASAALDGLRARGARDACPAIVTATGHASAEVRYVAVEVGAALGCLDRARLGALATGDPDPDVRKRAAELSR
jgi:HEAT repeat protein